NSSPPLERCLSTTQLHNVQTLVSPFCWKAASHRSHDLEEKPWETFGIPFR
ncbi:hypothetical protein KUCAC02_009994, partial [Chaenocephalus aceratus]